MGYQAPKLVAASMRLEELSIDLKELILDLRDPSCPDAYTRVYSFRREIGYVVANLGEGLPPPRDLTWVRR